MKFFNLRGKDADELVWDGPLVLADDGERYVSRCSGPTPRRSAR